MTKWASRFSLGLSTSIPRLHLKPSDIVKEDEIGMFVISNRLSQDTFIGPLQYLRYRRGPK
jgi:hypothetical protein